MKQRLLEISSGVRRRAIELRNAGTYGFLDRAVDAYRELAREASMDTGR